MAKMKEIDSRFISLENRVDSIESRLTVYENKFDAFVSEYHRNNKQIETQLEGISAQIATLANYIKDNSA